MYDTVTCYLNLSRRIAVEKFSGYRMIADSNNTVFRYWLAEKGGHVPHVTYYRQSPDDESGRLLVEFSIPQIANIDPRTNPTDADRELAFDRVNAYLAKHIGKLADVRTWMCQRVDYAWTWADVSPYLALYLQAFGGLHMPGMHKQSYPPDQGVMFKTAGQRGRWVKFYNKTKLLGDGDERQTLRFEVSNLQQATRYMADAWFQCERTVEQMTQRGRALYILCLMWHKLGLLSGDPLGGDDAMLMHNLRESFGRASNTAYYVLQLHRQYGNKCVSMNLVSKNTYYTWKQKLSQCDYLAYVPRPLPALSLPINDELKLFAVPDLLVEVSSAPATPLKKILWEKLAAKLGTPAAPALPILTEYMSYAQTPAELGRVREVVA